MRRLFVLGVAGALLASVLALVAGSPVQAANTAGEYLVDTNDDGKPDSRAFAGRDRYETALLLAKHYAGSPGRVDTLILASGETQIDAVSAAGLSGYEDAPVLLTRRDSLPAGVARFIEDQGVSTVFVVGGTDVVSDDVVELVEGLESKPTVTRVSGADRYGTAVEIAKRIRSSAVWCGSNDETVLLANGDLMPYTSAVLAGPMSYQMDMPLLLTASDELSSATGEYIDDQDLDRVVIIGDTDEVSDDVADAVEELGPDVERFAGDDAASTSVKIAQLMWNDCNGLDVDKTSVMLVNETATVDGVTAGPVAGIGLARNGSAIPILFVGGKLPASVRDWLAATPRFTGVLNDFSSKFTSHLKVVAVGGTAVVSASVMAQAVEAATTGPKLVATLKVDDASRNGDQTDDPTEFEIVFNEDVGDSDPIKMPAYLQRIVRVNGQKVTIADDADGNAKVENTRAGSMKPPDCGQKHKITVRLGTLKLKAGDKIELRPGDEPYGSLANANTGTNDLRPLQPASVTVGLKKPTPIPVPKVDLVLVEGEKSLYLRSNLKPDSTVRDGLTRVDDKITIKTKNGAKVKLVDDIGSLTSISADSNAWAPSLALAEAFDYNSDNDTTDTLEAADSAYYLRAGDTVTVERGAFMNADKVSSKLVRLTVEKRKPKFGVTSVVLGEPDKSEVNDDPADDKKPGGLPSDRFQALIVGGTRALGYVSRRPFVTFGPGDSTPSVGGVSYAKNDLVMFAKWDGVAAGAKGNHWVLYTKFADRYDEDKPLEIDVQMTSTGGVGKEAGRITVTFMNGKAKLSDVVKALRNDSEVSKNFTVGYVACGRVSSSVPNKTVGAKSTSNIWHDKAWYFRGGVSSVGIEVTFDDWVSTLFKESQSNVDRTATADYLGNRLRNSVLKAVVPGYTISGTDTTNFGGATFGADTSANFYGTIGSTPLLLRHAFESPAGQNVSVANVSFKAPSKTVHIRYTTQNPLKLAGLRAGPDKGIVKLAGTYYGAATGTDDSPVYNFVTSNLQVAANYLYEAKSAQDDNDEFGKYVDPDEIPDQINDDKSDDSKPATDDARIGTNVSEPVDFFNRGGSVRVRSGTVDSFVGRYDTSSNLDATLSLGECLGDADDSDCNK